MPLHELVYVSLADHDMAPGELVELLTQARAQNARRGITGLLVYRNREFMQLIEGEREVVLSLYERIEFDQRHQQVYKIWDAPIAQRSCQHWTMGFAEPRDSTWHALPDGHRVLDDGLLATGRSTAGQRLMRRLRDELLSGAGA